MHWQVEALRSRCPIKQILTLFVDWARHEGIFLSPEGAAATAAYDEGGTKKRMSGLLMSEYEGMISIQHRLTGLLEAPIRSIRPFELHCIFAQLLALPGTNIADFSVGVIVPTLAGDRIGVRFAKFMGTR